MKRFLMTIVAGMISLAALGQSMQPRQGGINGVSDNNLSVLSTFAAPDLAANPTSVFNRPGSMYYNHTIDRLLYRNGSTFLSVLSESLAASTYVSLSGSYANPAWITSLAAGKITGLTNTQVLYANSGGNITGSTNFTWNGQLLRLQGAASNIVLQLVNGDGTNTANLSVNTSGQMVIGTTGSRVNVTGSLAVSSGISTTTVGFSGSTANALLTLAATGFTLGRSTADANPTVIIDNGTNSATGLLLDIRRNGTTVASFSNLGLITTPGLTTTNLTTTGTVRFDFGSDATGDMHYRNGSNNISRLGVGSPGQYLGVSSGLPAWITPAFIGNSGNQTGLTGDKSTSGLWAFNANVSGPLTRTPIVHLNNPTAATNSVREQNSPALRFTGSAWSTYTSAPKSTDYHFYVTNTGGTGAQSSLRLDAEMGGVGGTLFSANIYELLGGGIRKELSVQGAVFAETMNLNPYTVATLPTVGIVSGSIAYVTDATAPAYLTTVIGGGSTKVLVRYDGTNWVCN